MNGVDSFAEYRKFNQSCWCSSRLPRNDGESSTSLQYIYRTEPHIIIKLYRTEPLYNETCMKAGTCWSLLYKIWAFVSKWNAIYKRDSSMFSYFHFIFPSIARMHFSIPHLSMLAVAALFTSSAAVDIEVGVSFNFSQDKY